MEKPMFSKLGLSTLAVAAALAVSTVPALADPSYSFLSTIPIPSSPDNNVGGTFKTYDISSFDPATQLDYVEDRSNKSIDIFSAKTNSYVGRLAGSGQVFQGQLPSNNFSGPSGLVLTDSPGQHEVFAGDGNSTVKVFNRSNGNLVTTISTGMPSDGRANETTFDPVTKQVLIGNDAATPYPFLSLINTTNNTVARKIVFNGSNGTPVATNGLQAPYYDPKTNQYYVSVPQFNGTGPGGVVQLNPNGDVSHIFDFSTAAGGSLGACAPAGLVGSTNGQLLVGCDAGQTVILNPSANGGNGSVKIIKQVTGADQVAYDPANDLFFVAARDNPTGPVLGIIDAATDSFVENLATSPGDHSVAVDPTSGEVFIPYGAAAGNTTCSAGCVAVFAPSSTTNVPEPGSFALLLTGLTGIIGAMRYRRRA